MRLVGILFLIFISLNSLSQEEKKEKFEFEHKLAFASGITLVPKVINDGQAEVLFLPTIGLDYNFEFHKYMGIGLINELELSKYAIETEDSIFIERENTITSIATFVIKPVKNWSVFIGGGAEMDKHRILPVLSAGTEYEISFGKEWFGKASIIYRYLFEYHSIGFAIGIGYTFKKKKK